MQPAYTWRKTTQQIAPAQHTPTPPGHYDLYPAFPLAPGLITLGYVALVDALGGQQQIIIDGYGGVLWEHVQQQLDAELRGRNLRVTWINIEQSMRPRADIDRLVEPFLGGDDPVFGTRFSGSLADFFDSERLRELHPDPQADMTIVYGCGAALCGWDALLVYVDVPKNEIQFRSRAGSVRNLGAEQLADAKQIYKRCYFVDWVALNRHKAELLPRINVIVDEQRPDLPALMSGDDLRHGLEQISHSFFRVRPWFEPGVWGGQWIKRLVPELPQDAPNYAWSFELIVPENGLVFQSDGYLLEVSFDLLMFHDHHAVIGECAKRFGYEFPIRFDFLDTFDGGNLSVQCHPRPSYAREKFGETFTQDETYYILDCAPNTRVYLGFNENIDPLAFRAELERSHAQGVAIDIEHFVNTEPAHKHDLFLIPNGTIHCAGINTMVLEISATPYIFTFKMYDWMRRDLDGRPRPLNIERAFDNLYFERKGAVVAQELVAHPRLINEGPDWQLIHLPTHREHFYDVHRFEFAQQVEAQTDGSCHIMSLVEGTSVMLETANGMRQRFNYAETFVIPAAAGSYRLINEGDQPAKVIKAFMKPASSDEGRQS